MNTPNVFFRRVSLRAAVLSIALAGLMAAPATVHAVSYMISVDTSGLSGQSGVLAFDLVAGDAMLPNNTAAISDLASNGMLSDTTGFTLTDTGFFNEELRDIVFGTSLSFMLNLTENHVAPGFDQFSFFLLAPSLLSTLNTTTDPTGANALFAIDITGQPGGSLLTFGSETSGVSWTVAANVPDDGATLPLAAAVCGVLLVWHGRRMRGVAGSVQFGR